MLSTFFSNVIPNSLRRVAVLCAFPVALFAQTNSTEYTITGTIKGLPDSTVVFLTRAAQPQSTVATAYAQKGKFVLFGSVDEPDVYQLSFIGYKPTREIFLTPASLTVSGDVKLLGDLAVSGSAAQSDFNQYNAKFEGLRNKLTKLVGQINKTEQGHKRDSLINVFEGVKKQVLMQVDQFVDAKPASAVAPFVVYVTSPVGNDVQALERRYNKLAPTVQNSFYGKQIAAYLASTKVGQEGTQAIDFTQNDTADKPVSLSSFRGKYVLVDFWASWCGPCRHENPAVVNAYNTFKDKNFTVLGVSLDQSKDRWVQAINADNLTWTHVSDLKYWQNAAAQLYHIQSIPANMLIDPNGKIIGRNLRGEDLFQALGKLLN